MEAFESLGVGAVLVIPLVLGIVQAAKRLGVEGKASFVLALVVGGAFGALREAMLQGLIPEEALPWITVGLVGIVGGLAATGLYDLASGLQRVKLPGDLTGAELDEALAERDAELRG